MIPDKALKTLEYDKILDRLASHTSFSLGRELALALRPAVDIEAVSDLQDQVREATRVVSSHADSALGGAHDIRAAVTRAVLGGVLDPLALLDVQSTLECSDRLRTTLVRLDPEEYPWLAAQRARLGSFREISELIARSIDGQGEVMDSASQALAKIRADMRVAYQRLMDRLQSILTSQAYRSAVQEPIITERNGRYVIPVKADARGVIRGLVHDHSSSGATLYVEPLQTTDLNNHWRELQLQETQEIERILAYIAERIGAQGPAIMQAVQTLAVLDLTFAKTRYGMAMRGSVPALGEDGVLMFEEARHPLLSGEVVPIDVRLGDEFRILLVTGPNTGGKTVALKTVGLLTLMAQSGLPIPAAPTSKAAVFQGIFADIGDEQSIEQSLSTFSSHLTNIITILRDMPDNSLLLLDELGAGTDPAEGSALARSLLTFLLDRDVRLMATTHYSELKAFAASTEGVANASVEFDVESLSPTYRLTIGLPGRSNALAIAQRLGLPQEIIAGSQQYISDESLHVETMLADIQDERAQTAELLAQASAAEREARALRLHLEHEVQQVLAEREQILRAARSAAEASVAALRHELDRAETELRLADASLSQRPLVDARQRVESAVTVHHRLLAEPPVETAAQHAEVSVPVASGGLAVGDRVALLRTGQEGTVVNMPRSGQQLELQIGPFKTRVKQADVRLVARGSDRRTPDDFQGSVTVQRASVPAPSVELDMRGWRVDDVLQELERYISDAFLANLPFVRIIHGKGTGALRQVVREELATNPLVAGFRPADAREGGEGVTVAMLG